MEQEILAKMPRHAYFSLEHNPHYCWSDEVSTVQEWFKQRTSDEPEWEHPVWISEEQKEKAFRTNRVWHAWWFLSRNEDENKSFLACDLDALMEFLMAERVKQEC